MDSLSILNKAVYNNLEEILHKIDDRITFKLYAFIYKNSDSLAETFRIKKTLSSQSNSQELETIQEKIDQVEDVLQKLGIHFDSEQDELHSFIKKLTIDNLNANVHYEFQENSIEDLSDSNVEIENFQLQVVNQPTILYTNSFNALVDEEPSEIKYILCIEDVDPETRYLFLHKPQLSFLSMVLEYYFQDYYLASNEYSFILNSNGDSINTKYKEDESQFLQRMARLFLGKVQYLLEQSADQNSSIVIESQLSDTAKNQYYFNNLLEKLDGISNKTYEGKNPFGSILLLSKELLQDVKLINYSIKFEDQQPILWEDARRIRKLLEITNEEGDMYLIADEEAVYGIGEIDWSKLGDSLIFKVEFKGLSKYDLLLVTTEEREPTDAHVVIKEEAKIFQMTTSLEIILRKIISIGFKHPNISSSGFTPKVFERTMHGQFKETAISNEAIEKLQLIIQKATEQKSGTMVVITTESTAKKEIKRLRKQSTPIIPCKIDTSFIKYLTAIDGALYFDIHGNCHAIGVILDGIADEAAGDASRGARFNSAYRYFNKLSKDNIGCIIAVISEDGMINLIPEPVNEAAVRKLIREMCSYVLDENLEDKDKETQWSSAEERFAKLEDEIAVDHHDYFKLADTCFNNKWFDKAIKYYERGLEAAGRFMLQYTRNLIKNYLTYLNNSQDNLLNMEYLKFLLKKSESIFQHVKNTQINHHDYNNMAILLKLVGDQTQGVRRDKYYNQALEYYTEAINKDKNNPTIIFQNRAFLYFRMGLLTEAIEDFIDSEVRESSSRNIAWIKKIIEHDNDLYPVVVNSYMNKKNEQHKSDELEALIEEFKTILNVEGVESFLEAAPSSENVPDVQQL